MVGITGDYSHFNAQLIIDTIISTALLPAVAVIIILLAIRRGVVAIKKDNISTPNIVTASVKSIAVSFLLYCLIWCLHIFLIAPKMIGCCAVESTLIDSATEVIIGSLIYFTVYSVLIGVVYLFFTIFHRKFLKVSLSLILFFPAILMSLKSIRIQK